MTIEINKETQSKNKAILEKFINLYSERDAVDDAIKTLKDDIKDDIDKDDLANILKIAQAMAKGKLSEVKQKAEQFLDVVDSLT